MSLSLSPGAGSKSVLRAFVAISLLLSGCCRVARAATYVVAAPVVRHAGESGSVKNGVAGVQSSIAQAMGVNGSVPWSIVIGLTLLTLIPALLLAMTPMVRLLVSFTFCARHLGRRRLPRTRC